MKDKDRLRERKYKEHETLQSCINLVKETLNLEQPSKESDELESFKILVEIVVDSNLQRQHEIN
jgi:hypothetical protein